VGDDCCRSCLELAVGASPKKTGCCPPKFLCPRPPPLASRRAARVEKAKAVFPRPAGGVLKPLVRGQTVKYNTKQRLGRGFTLEELKVRER
jgi:large subunit ribosomal protein L13e